MREPHITNLGAVRVQMEAKIAAHQQFVLRNGVFLMSTVNAIPPVDLYLISEKSIWKNQVRRTGFLVYFELDFYCLCSLQKLIFFAG